MFSKNGHQAYEDKAFRRIDCLNNEAVSLAGLRSENGVFASSEV